MAMSRMTMGQAASTATSMPASSKKTCLCLSECDANRYRHCTGGSGKEQSCARVERDYNIRLRVGLLFVMLATSSIGVFAPILVASYVSPSHPVFTVLRQFGTGVIISTAFIHVSARVRQRISADTDVNPPKALHARQLDVCK